MSEKGATALKSEERRALILLGATAVIATVWAALWTTAKTPQDAVWNFPTGPPFRHLTIYVIPTLQWFILFFMGYAFFAFWYFCVDWLSGRKGTVVRELCHVVAIGFLGLYAVAFIFFVPAAEASFFLPDSVQTYYWTGWTVLFFLLESAVVSFAINQSEILARWFNKSDKVLFSVIIGSASIVRDGLALLIKRLRRIRRKR